MGKTTSKKQNMIKPLHSNSSKQSNKPGFFNFIFMCGLMLMTMQGSSQTHIAWQKSIGTEYADQSISVFQDLKGNTVVVGLEPHQDFTGNVRNYMMLTKLDPEGN